MHTIPTPTSSELRANPFLPPTTQQRQDFNFVQEHFRVQPIQSPNSSLWSATSPQQSASTSSTPRRTPRTSSLTNTSISVPRIEIANSLQPPQHRALSPTSFIPEIRLSSTHPGRTRATPVLNPNPPTLSRTNDHTYLFPLDHKTWNPPPPLYVPQTRECSHSNFDQLISIDTEGTVRYRLTPYPIKVETILETISPEEIVLDNMFSKASLIESGIFSKEQLIQERKRDLLHEYMRDREQPLQEAQSANAQKLLELEQLGLLQTYKNYEHSLK